MVRRVGFGNAEAVDNRRPSRKSKTRANTDRSDVSEMSASSRAAQFLFLLIWLVGWSGGILFGIIMMLGNDGIPIIFLAFGVAFALVFWIAVAKRLIALLRGS